MLSAADTSGFRPGTFIFYLPGMEGLAGAGVLEPSTKVPYNSEFGTVLPITMNLNIMETYSLTRILA
jgi:hypothetical protein